ncbi:MAG: type II toxin-antitoxin system RelB/DinJ family antitoxin, partial [Oscillospiraceae bacterium]|nr:type II toxin-antitoxin system RelB/DinJ family antitoxin [Oscillospiraceae bacterium]
KNVLQLAIHDVIIISERGRSTMANKTANVTVRVQPEIKQQAERVLDRLGIPVSVLIDSLYRQIIMTNGIPYSLSIPSIPTADSISKAEFDAMMEQGLAQAKAGDGLELKEAFAKIHENI